MRTQGIVYLLLFLCLPVTTPDFKHLIIIIFYLVHVA